MRWHPITAETKEKVRILSGSGMLSKHIAAELGICTASVSNVRKQLGLSQNETEPLSPAMEARIRKLLREGHGAPFISKTLAVTHARVYQVKRASNLKGRPGTTGFRFTLSELQKRDLRREIRASEKRLAAKFGISRLYLRRFQQRGRS
jgi:hypothetical protein